MVRTGSPSSGSTVGKRIQVLPGRTAVPATITRTGAVRRRDDLRREPWAWRAAPGRPFGCRPAAGITGGRGHGAADDDGGAGRGVGGAGGRLAAGVVGGGSGAGRRGGRRLAGGGDPAAVRDRRLACGAAGIGRGDGVLTWAGAGAARPHAVRRGRRPRAGRRRGTRDHRGRGVG